jgi:hypothetical protein
MRDAVAAAAAAAAAPKPGGSTHTLHCTGLFAVGSHFNKKLLTTSETNPPLYYLGCYFHKGLNCLLEAFPIDWLYFDMFAQP